MSRILITDLEGTLLGGTPGDRRRLRDALDRHPEPTRVFATGRGVPSIRLLLSQDPLVPQPRWIIADVGATVIDCQDHCSVDSLQDQLRAKWPGAERVRAAMDRFPALTYQHGVAQDGRCSYLLAPDQLTDQITDAVQALGRSWVYSADRYFDVLPARASKGNAVRALAKKLDWSMDSVLVAGDTLNDLSMFRLGAHGVVVGGAEPALRAAVADDPLTVHPRRRGAGGILTALQDLGWVTPDPRPVARRHPLVVAYHRPPVQWTGGRWQPPASPNGIIPTLTSAFADGLPGVWAAALVGADDDPGHGRPTGPPLALLPLSRSEWSGYFHRACKEALWPVLMSEPSRAVLDDRAWAAYRSVNQRFAEHISNRAAPYATVWLHDYNLWLVPGLLRASRPDLRTGLFHHTPFPSPETFASLPVARELLSSLAALDWVGFHTRGFAEHFRQTLAGFPAPPALPRIEVHPLGIDRPAIEALARSRTPRLREAGQLVVLSVERLDYAKAPVQKVDAVERLLSHYPELRGRLTFRLVCPPPEPGITAYDSTRELLEQRIAQVNSTWGEPGRQPVDYRPERLSFAEVVEEYLAADVLWVTPLQDGMNLTAKEFIATQAALSPWRPGGPGILVLSRYAGAATELARGALLTDPRSPDDLSSVLSRALALTPAERRARMAHLSRLLGHDRPADWAARIVGAIRGAGSRITAPPRVPSPC
jgi:HAD superfamily hydrolase (TIGR01484 family)